MKLIYLIIITCFRVLSSGIQALLVTAILVSTVIYFITHPKILLLFMFVSIVSCVIFGIFIILKDYFEYMKDPSKCIFFGSRPTDPNKDPIREPRGAYSKDDEL